MPLEGLLWLFIGGEVIFLVIMVTLIVDRIRRYRGYIP